MTENEARYIARMFNAFRENMLFVDSTDKDSELLDIMKQKYHDCGRWSAGSEGARVWLIMHVTEHGVPGGRYYDKPHIVERALAQREVPMIERPEAK
jgi:hypothetical protein